MDLKSLVLGTRERIAGAVYRTIVVLAALAAGATAYQYDLWRLGAVQGVRYARIERLSRIGTVVSVALNLGLGLAIVATEADPGPLNSTPSTSSSAGGRPCSDE